MIIGDQQSENLDSKMADGRVKAGLPLQSLVVSYSQEENQLPRCHGYVPQLKYRIGDTYGKVSEVPQGKSSFMRSQSKMTFDQFNFDLISGITHMKDYSEDTVKFHFIPGYTGYIPKLRFSYGDPYTKASINSMNDFKTEQEAYRHRKAEMENLTNLRSPMKSIASENLVRNKLCEFTYNSSSKTAMPPRSLTEAHIPGYTGYIPKIKATEIGLGHRYHTVNSTALKKFWDRKFPMEQNLAPPNKSKQEIYRTEGMNPYYTGYIPQKRYQYGNTYGNTCRSLEVCSGQNSSLDHHQETRAFSAIF